MKPAPLLAGCREHLAHRLPEPQRPVADGQHRGGHPAAAATPQQISPRLGGLPIAVGQRDELLAAIGPHPDHHQQAEFLLLETDLEVDAVDPQVDVVGTRQIALPEGLGLVLPLRGQPGDRRGRQSRTRAEELLQGRTEVAGRQAVQVQQRQHLGHLRRLACPRRQDRRGKPLPLCGIGVDAPVVDPRRRHRDRPRRGQHVALAVIAVADHQAPSVLVDLTGMGVDVGGHLGLQRRRQHLPGAVADDLIEQRPTDTIVLLVGRFRVVNYREHGRTFPNQRANAGLDQSYLDFQIILGKVRPLSRRLAEAHPQVLIIAQGGTASRTCAVRRIFARPTPMSFFSRCLQTEHSPPKGGPDSSGTEFCFCVPAAR